MWLGKSGVTLKNYVWCALYVNLNLLLQCQTVQEPQQLSLEVISMYPTSIMNWLAYYNYICGDIAPGYKGFAFMLTSRRQSAVPGRT